MNNISRMVKRIFRWVADGLLWIARRTGMTYNEVNILVYYLLIPLSWTIMFDVLIGAGVTTTALLLVWLGIYIGARHNFREWCDRTFKKSVDFLNLFNRWGGNYVLNSVIICVLTPLIVYGVLAYLLITQG